MDNIGNTCIISAGIGGWYAQGVSRLERSLMFHGYAGQVLTWKDEYPEGFDSFEYDPYAIKIYAIRSAIKRGFSIFLWSDASIWAIKNPHPIFDIINEHGVFGFRTGYNCAQTCSDSALHWAGITRDEAEHIPETASGLVGLNLNNPNGREVWDLWSEGCDLGLFRTSRTHNIDESSDSRFLFSRQDQSIYSLAIHKAGINFLYEDYVSYYDGRQPESYNKKVLFLISGL